MLSIVELGVSQSVTDEHFGLKINLFLQATSVTQPLQFLILLGY